MSFFSELKRRNVFRVALLYLVASWLIIQVADVGVSLLSLPDWTGRFIFLLLLIGFPLVVVFSWAYELTPEGLKRERDVERDASITHETARKLNTAVIALLLIAVGGLIADRLIPETAPPAETVVGAGTNLAVAEKSIAVLPFVNMSSDQENEYFSDGLSEELLNLLAKIPDLKVAARTSSFSFKDSDADIPEIADTLQVAHVLEGSVRKSGNDIRVTAQLIKASDGYHLWSETWDRTLVDVFAIQDEIAERVVEALKVTLLGEAPHARVTDPLAYEYYLKARAAADLSTEQSMSEAAQLLAQALAIDPEWSQAWAELSVVQTNQTGMGHLAPEIGFERARQSGERALKIDPENARALSGLGWNAMYWEHDFAKAAELLERARQLEPGNASVLNSLGVLKGVFGRRQTMISLYESALERDPVAVSVLGNLAAAYLNNDRLEDAEPLIQRIADVSPGSAAALWYTAWMQWWQGDAEAALDGFTAYGGSLGDWGRAVSLYNLGQDEELNELIEQLIRNAARPTILAVIYAYIEEDDLAFEWFDKAFEARDDWLIEIRMYESLERLYDDPRWEALLRKIGISDADAERIGI